MASDADYAAFLERANQDSSGGASGTATTQSNKTVGTKSVDTAVPAVLEGVDEYFMSEADEPFEAVALAWGGGKEVDAEALKSLLAHDAAVEGVDAKVFAPYKNVVEAVRQAGDGEVRFFRVELGGARVEYWAVGVDGKAGRLVGLKALAVES